MGIWVTVAMNKEAPSVTDLRQLFEKVCWTQRVTYASVNGIAKLVLTTA